MIIVVVVKMHEGENDFAGGLEFHKRAKAALEHLRPGEKLVIDLDGLFLDSSLIGTLLAIHTTCRKRARDMELINISGQTMKILELSGLCRVLGLPETERGK